jgi:hypothetical protein
LRFRRLIHINEQRVSHVADLVSWMQRQWRL